MIDWWNETDYSVSDFFLSDNVELQTAFYGIYMQIQRVL